MTAARISRQRASDRRRLRATPGAVSELEGWVLSAACDLVEPPGSAARQTREIEPFYTLKEAATQLNLKYWHLLRMSRRGELRLYKAGSGRNRVLLSEVMAAIRRCSEQEPSPDGGKAPVFSEASRA